jgi:hypothetical protein
VGKDEEESSEKQRVAKAKKVKFVCVAFDNRFLRCERNWAWDSNPAILSAIMPAILKSCQQSYNPASNPTILPAILQSCQQS